MKHLIKKLTPYQKDVLTVLSDMDENNYIHGVYDVNTGKEIFTVTNGEDDFQDLRQSTMNKLIELPFMFGISIPGCDTIIRQKYYIPKRYKADVYVALLKDSIK